MPIARTEPQAMAFDRGPRVLLADDTEIVRELTGRMLERMGCDVDAAEDGYEALELAQLCWYDLILLDLDMPVMDGAEAARAIRTLAKNRSTLIVAVSAFLGTVGNPNDRWRIFDGEIAKPVSMDRLRQVISAALVTTSLTRSSPEQDLGMNDGGGMKERHNEMAYVQESTL